MKRDLAPERNSTTQAIFQVGRDPELERLLRMRIAAAAVLWGLALGWGGFAEVRYLLLHVSTGASVLVTAIALFVLAKRPAESVRVANLHVAADLAIMPAFTLATGGWQSPFAAMLVVKTIGSSLLVGRTRGTAFGGATLALAVAAWTVDAVRAAGPGVPLLDVVVPPLLVGGILGTFGAVILQAASLPMDAYRDRRKQLVSENRRLEEAIGELEVQNQRLTALHELSGAIGTLGTIDEVVGKLRDAVEKTFPGRLASFFVYRREQGRLEPLSLAPGTDAARAERLAGPDGELARALGGTLSGDGAPPSLQFRDGGDKLAQRGASAQAEGRATSGMLDPQAISQVTVPLLLAGRTVGLLVLETRSPYPFDEDDQQLLSTMGNEMAVALRNAELNTRSKQLWEFQQSLIENANALILVVDASGDVEVANKAFVALVEPAQDPVRRPVAELLVPRSAEDLKAALAMAHAGTAVENLRLDLRHGAGGERRAVFNLAPVRDRGAKDEGTFRHVIAVGQDITRVELLEREVLHSEKLASLGTFVAGIAHEMNNPLTAITAYGDYLRRAFKRGEATPDAGDKLDNIVYAGERIQGFVQSLLGFARPVSGVRPDLDLNGVIRDSVRLCQYDLKKVQVEVEVDLAEELPPVAGIEAELQQVFINLITNAAHAAPKEGAKLRIASARGDDGVRVTVGDNGHGIAPEVLPRIFEAFYSTKAEGKGSGLGLSIVKRIIDHHAGQIDVQSEIGVGTTFTIEIPHAKATERAAPADAPPAPGPKVGAGGS